MKTNRTLIAMCIAGVFASGSLYAKDKWEYHTDGWENTKSYGSVTIANDSASQWGPWEEFVQPAAGGVPTPSVAFLGAGEGDPYNILPNPIPPNPEVGCAAGEWCGYMAYSVKNKYEHTDWSYEKVKVKDKYGHGYHYEWQWVSHTDTYTTRTDLQPAEMRLQFVKPDYPWYGKGEISFLSDLAEFNAAVGTDAQEIGVRFDWQQGDFRSYNPWDNVVLEGLADAWRPWYYYYDSSDEDWKDIRKYATMGLLEVKLENQVEAVEAYVRNSSGCEGSCDVLKEMKVYAPYVAGQVTSLVEMAGLSASSATARYSGRSYGGGSVNMQVSFAGTGSWSGEWRGGYLPNFNASGGISGANFASSSVTGCGITAGNVLGSFYGPQAAAAGGVADVTKNGTRYVDVFLATKQPSYK